MRRFLHAAGLVLVPCLLAVQATSGQQRPLPGGQTAVDDALILGRVIDGDTGAPVPGVVVMRLGPQAADPTEQSTGPDRVLTNSDGQFVLRDLPEGAIRIVASKAGYQTGGFGVGPSGGDPRSILLGAGETRTDVVIRLWQFASIAGTVVDEFGDPMVSVEVRAIQHVVAAGVPQLRARGNAATDDRGRYLLSPLPPGNYLVSVPASTITAMTTSLDTIRSMTPQERSAAAVQPLPAGGIRTGDVEIVSPIPGLQPIPPRPGERVQIYRTMFHPASPTAEQAQTLNLASGTRLEGIDIQMLVTPALHVRGTVVDESGGPAANVALRLRTAAGLGQGESWDIERTTSGPDGAFAFAAVPPGDYRISVMEIVTPPAPPPPASAMIGAGATPMLRLPSQTVRWAETPVSVGAVDVTDVAVMLRPGHTVSGRFEFRGSQQPPAPEALRAVPIVLEPVGHQPSRLPRGAQVDDSGRFTTAGHPPGRYLVRVRTTTPPWMVEAVISAGRDVSLDPIFLDDNIENVTVVFTDTPSVAQLSGTVDESASASLPTYVVAIPADYQRWIGDGMSPDRASMQPVSDGRYHLVALPPGDYLVAAVAVEARPELQDREFVARLVPGATRVSLGRGEVRLQALRATVIGREQR